MQLGKLEALKDRKPQENFNSKSERREGGREESTMENVALREAATTSEDATLLQKQFMTSKSKEITTEPTTGESENVALENMKSKVQKKLHFEEPHLKSKEVGHLGLFLQ